MTGILVRAKSLADADLLESELVNAGYDFVRKKGLKKVFDIETNLNDFFFKDSPLIAQARSKSELKSQVHKPAYAVQDLPNIDATTLDINDPSWALGRICRKLPNWNRDLPPNNLSTSFHSIRTGKGVDAYIIESAGWAPTHPDFEGRAKRLDGTTWADGNPLTDHANAVASCTGGKVCGVAKECDIWMVQAGFGNGFDTLELTVAIDELLIHYNSRAGLNRPAVINMSTIGQTLGIDLIEDCMEVGIVWVQPAGNDKNYIEAGSSVNSQAASHPEMINVGASTLSDHIVVRGAFLSSYGPDIDVYAPGLNIYTARTTTDAQYRSWSGTSFSGPYTAGVVACMLQGYGRLTNRSQVMAVKQKLRANCTIPVRVPPSYDHFYTYPPENAGGLLYLDPWTPFETIAGLTPL